MLRLHSPNSGGVSGSGRGVRGGRRKKEKERGPQLVPQIPNLIGSVISALLIDGYNPPGVPRGPGRGPASLGDNAPHRCGEMMCADSGYSRAGLGQVEGDSD